MRYVIPGRGEFSIPLLISLLAVLAFAILFFDIWSTSLSYAQLLQPGTQDELLSPNAQSNLSPANNTCNRNDIIC